MTLDEAPHPHVLLVSFPAQGHINPALEFAKRLVKAGVQITFATPLSAHKQISKPQNTLPGLSFVGFSDGYDGDFNLGINLDIYMSEFQHNGMKNLKQLIINLNNSESSPITRVFYCNLIPWVALVAREFHIPSTLLWNQAAAVFDLYYHIFHGYEDFIRDNIVKGDTFLLQLPGLPPLTSGDIPPFFMPSNVHGFARPTWKAHLDVLDEEETKPIVLVNTFDALETEPLKAIGEYYSLIAVGPLIPSAFLDRHDPSNNSLGGDLSKCLESEKYTEWLNSKNSSSVIYVSFGSLSVLARPQMEQMARSLIDTGRPFLWVMRENQKEEGKQDEELSCRGELEKQGMIVPWCLQVEVLSHPSIGCFLTHCGWNSTFESLASGVPVVAFPQWTDQMPNAKMVQDVWKTGVRVRKNETKGVVEAEEIKRCLELVMGSNERGEEMRRNAKKWKDLAREAAMEDGSSCKNLKTFVDEVF